MTVHNFKKTGELAGYVLEFAKRDLENRGEFIGMTIAAAAHGHFLTVRCALPASERQSVLDRLIPIFDSVGVIEYVISTAQSESSEAYDRILTVEGSRGNPTIISHRDTCWDSDHTHVEGFEIINQEVLDLESQFNLFRQSSVPFEDAMAWLMRSVNDDLKFILLGFEDVICEWKITRTTKMH